MNNKPQQTSILVVDDDAGQRELLVSCVEQLGLGCVSAEHGQKALEVLGDHPVDLVLSDIQMPEMDGLSLLRAMRASGFDMPVLLVTGYADVSQAVKAMELGAVNYLEKPIDLEELRAHLQKALGQDCANGSPLNLMTGTVARSPEILSVLEDVALVAPSMARVMIFGESGTGKEVIADHLHHWSERVKGPLVKLNCAAIPENLLESELFGHEKGAFTGANTQRKGCFERAHGGTLFLDEIGEMAPELQAKMLRVLQDSCVTRVGGADVQHVDVRVVSATHRDLELEMEEGRFREDLFYRLNVVEIHVPSLRDRKADIPPLAMAFAEKVSKKGVRFAPAFEKSLCQYDWPGNVRELQNAMERAVLLARGGLFMPEHLPRRLLKSLSEQPPQQADPQATLSDFAKTIPSDNPHEPVQHQEDHPPTNLEGREEEHILNILNACSGNRSEAARELGVSRRTLLYRIKKMEAKGFEIPGPRGRRNTSES